MSDTDPVLRAAGDDDDALSCRQWAWAFFREMYPPPCPGHLVLCTAPPGNDKDAPLTTRSFPVADLAGAAAYAQAMAAHGHVWFGVGTQAQAPRGRKRGGSKTVAAIPGVWSDVDVLHPVHTKTDLPATVEQAMALIARVGLPPTLVIDTGHGLQAYWLFHEPWVFVVDGEDDQDQRAEAQRLLNDFKATVAGYAKEKGWSVDAVADLARLMRPPGTVNHKEPADPRPVRVHVYNPECRYTVEQIRGLIRLPQPQSLPEPAPPCPDDEPAVGTPPPDIDEGLVGVEFLYDDNLLLDRARGAANGRRFAAAWDGDNTAYGNDASRGDLALCGFLAFWTGKDEARMDRLFRRSKRQRGKWDEVHSADGRTYGQMTIAKAIAGCRDVYDPRRGNEPAEDKDEGAANAGAPETTDTTIKVGGEWGEPIPLDTPQAPPMPEGIFQGWLADKIAAVASATETPPELAAMNAVAVLSTVLQARFSLLVEPGYFEPLNTYTATVLDAGNRKTAAQQRMTGPLLAWEREQAAAYAQKIRDAESARRTEEGRIRHLRTRAEKTGDVAEYERLKREIAEMEAQLPEVPTTPRLLCEDVTPEHLATVMAHNGGRVGIVADEGGLIENFTGRYSGGVANFDLLLKGHSVSSFRVDRGSRPPIFLERPHVTIGLSVQPDVIAGMAAKPGFRGRGVLARFAFVLPASQLGFRRLATTPEPDHVCRAYDEAVRALIDAPPRSAADGRLIPHVLRLTPAAHARWKAFAHEVEAWMRPGGRMEYVRDWAGKAPGLCARLAGVLHCADYASCATQVLDVDEACAARAVAMTRWLADHAEVAFGLVAVDDGLLKARRLWREIEKRRRRRFTAREAWNPLRGTYAKVADVEPGFLRLMDHNVIAEPPQADHGKAGRPSRVFVVNPRLAEGWE